MLFLHRKIDCGHSFKQPWLNDAVLASTNNLGFEQITTFHLIQAVIFIAQKKHSMYHISANIMAYI